MNKTEIKTNDYNEDERMTMKQKICIGTSIGAFIAIGVLGCYYVKSNNNSTTMMNDIMLEGGVYDAAISNLSRRIDNKRCRLNKFNLERTCNLEKISKLEEEIEKLSKILQYAVAKRATMIED